MSDIGYTARTGLVSGVECRQPMIKARGYKDIILPCSGEGAGSIPHYQDDLRLLWTLAPGHQRVKAELWEPQSAQALSLPLCSDRDTTLGSNRSP